MVRLFKILSFQITRMVSQDTILSPSQRALIPKSKMDVESIEHLTPLSPSTLAPLIPHLLTWIQDSNWPISQPIIELLRKHPSIVIEPVRKVLRDEAGEEDDGAWKSNCLNGLVVEMERGFQMEFKDELVRMAKSPTNEELEWETMDVAKDVLGELGITLDESSKPPSDKDGDSVSK
ncbi:hypothetical protein DL95DRAFT_443635 [Leptodontidium sp. 2 PMI_412]|nr:hypothetical protein DL95DRAFT_443635 [Leptodontidium sp. 2 PMI_412]